MGKFLINFRIILILIISFNTMIAQNNTQKLNLMPYPQKIQLLDGKLSVSENFNVNYNINSEKVRKASNRFLARLSKRSGIFLAKPFAELSETNSVAVVNINFNEVVELKFGIDESYKIQINDSSIVLEAPNDIGVIRGLETLQQLFTIDSNGFYFPKVIIEDFPRFPWRGLLIDVCRHFMPLDVLKRNIEGMAAVKMNVFHWHLSEDQGFRVESKVYPKLTELGSDGLFYTHEEVKDIIDFAADRGIRVVPEFDVPGHATAILTAYPEYASAPGPYKIERNWGIFDPTLNPIKDETYIFLRNLFTEMAELFPDEYFHIGGDENNGVQWDNNEEIQQFMKENQLLDNHALQGFFNNKLLSILTNLDKKMVGWDEIFHPSMPNNIVIQSWRGKEALVEAAKLGYQTILSNGYYIDLMQPTDFHYLNDPLPADIDLLEDEQKMILGGEATMWSELVSTENIDSRIWPRTAAIAERFWSARDSNNVENMYMRLEYISNLLEEYGVEHIKNYDIMLRRLTNYNDTKSLHNLISVIEPVKLYKRHELKKLTQQSPLTRVVDASTADAKSAREFRILVSEYLKTRDKKLFDQIKNSLNLWENNHENLVKVINNSPILKEIQPMSQNLKDVARLGLEILDLISREIKADEQWYNSSISAIEKFKEPIAETELMIVSAIEELLNSIK